MKVLWKQNSRYFIYNHGCYPWWKIWNDFLPSSSIKLLESYILKIEEYCLIVSLFNSQTFPFWNFYHSIQSDHHADIAWILTVGRKRQRGIRVVAIVFLVSEKSLKIIYLSYRLFGYIREYIWYEILNGTCFGFPSL